MPQVFVDLDGVLADFDGYYYRCFLERTDRGAPEPPDMWANINAHGSFFETLPLLPDALTLWHGVCAVHPAPVVLSGLPRHGIHETHKRAWVARHLGPAVPVICCQSQHKYRHGRRGDVLVDDWSRYRDKWERMGGIFILHTSVAESLAAVRQHLGVAA